MTKKNKKDHIYLLKKFCFVFHSTKSNRDRRCQALQVTKRKRIKESKKTRVHFKSAKPEPVTVLKKIKNKKNVHFSVEITGLL